MPVCTCVCVMKGGGKGGEKKGDVLGQNGFLCVCFFMIEILLEISVHHFSTAF